MKVSKNIIVVCLLFGGQSVGLFGAIGSRGTKNVPTPRPGAPVDQAPKLPARDTVEVSEKFGQGLDIFAVSMKVLLDYLKLPANERTSEKFKVASKAQVAFANSFKGVLESDSKRFYVELFNKFDNDLSSLDANDYNLWKSAAISITNQFLTKYPDRMDPVMNEVRKQIDQMAQFHGFDRARTISEVSDIARQLIELNPLLRALPSQGQVQKPLLGQKLELMSLEPMSSEKKLDQSSLSSDWSALSNIPKQLPFESLPQQQGQPQMSSGSIITEAPVSYGKGQEFDNLIEQLGQNWDTQRGVNDQWFASMKSFLINRSKEGKMGDGEINQLLRIVDNAVQKQLIENAGFKDTVASKIGESVGQELYAEWAREVNPQ